jgi:hypothetical protein
MVRHDEDCLQVGRQGVADFQILAVLKKPLSRVVSSSSFRIEDYKLAKKRSLNERRLAHRKARTGQSWEIVTPREGRP